MLKVALNTLTLCKTWLTRPGEVDTVHCIVFIADKKKDRTFSVFRWVFFSCKTNHLILAIL